MAGSSSCSSALTDVTLPTKRRRIWDDSKEEPSLLTFTPSTKVRCAPASSSCTISRLTLPVALVMRTQAATLKEDRSEEHTSELQSLMRNSYAVFCWKKNRKHEIRIAGNHTI